MKHFFFKMFFTCLLGISSVMTIFPQTKNDYTAIDHHARKAPPTVSTDLPKLVAYLTQTAANEGEKVRSFYAWMTYNIAYDMQAYNKGRQRINQSNQDILRRGKAVCFGYAKLMQAMCEKAGIRCEVIVGYSKGALTSTPDLRNPDHAWNAVQIDGQWHLMDVTWGSGVVYNGTSDFVREFQEEYFLTSPKAFIVNHLPADPMWQLLDCPIQAKQFKQSAAAIQAVVRSSQQCFSFADSIAQFQRLSKPKKALKTALNTYRFNPTSENAEELGHAYMDYEFYLSEEAKNLRDNWNYERLLAKQREIMAVYTTAEKYIELLDRQKENKAITFYNYGVTLSQKIPSLEQADDYRSVVAVCEEMMVYFKKADAILAHLPSNFMIEQTREDCRLNMNALVNNLAIYRARVR